MNIFRVKEIEDCIGDALTREISFSEALTKDFSDFLGKYGKYEFYGNIPKPYFRVYFHDKFYIKGIIGNTTARLIITEFTFENSLNYFKKLIESYNQSKVSKYN